MSSLPNIREFDDAELAESPSDSEELLLLKFKERMQRKRELWEQEQRECAECKAREARKRAEREEREAREWEAREEKEKVACEEVRLGKVSAQRLKRRCP